MWYSYQAMVNKINFKMLFTDVPTRLKIAVAIAILREKPEGVSGEEYTRTLADAVQSSQVQWQRKYRQAEAQILHLHQQLIMQGSRNKQLELECSGISKILESKTIV